MLRAINRAPIGLRLSLIGNRQRLPAHL